MEGGGRRTGEKERGKRSYESLRTKKSPLSGKETRSVPIGHTRDDLAPSNSAPFDARSLPVVGTAGGGSSTKRGEAMTMPAVASYRAVATRVSLGRFKKSLRSNVRSADFLVVIS